ncbi:MAG TPA: hypothetical protein VH253_06290 [Phycisphaerae bacterium]|nr:hypothetical protein [Phycisphaerae bacterium]
MSAFALPLAERLVFEHVQSRSRKAPFYCDDSAAMIAADTGLPVNLVGKARRDLVRLGVLMVERPAGFAPRVALARWPSLPDNPALHRMPLRKHVARSAAALATVLQEVGQLARQFLELGDGETSAALAGALEHIRPAWAVLADTSSAAVAIGALDGEVE